MNIIGNNISLQPLTNKGCPQTALILYLGTEYTNLIVSYLGLNAFAFL